MSTPDHGTKTPARCLRRPAGRGGLWESRRARPRDANIRGVEAGAITGKPPSSGGGTAGDGALIRSQRRWSVRGHRGNGKYVSLAGPYSQTGSGNLFLQLLHGWRWLHCRSFISPLPYNTNRRSRKSRLPRNAPDAGTRACGQGLRRSMYLSSDAALGGYMARERTFCFLRRHSLHDAVLRGLRGHAVDALELILALKETPIKRQTEEDEDYRPAKKRSGVFASSFQVGAKASKEFLQPRRI
jgi:hypothetical protein